MTTLNFEKDFAPKYFCAFHTLRSLGYLPVRERTNSLNIKNIGNLLVYRLTPVNSIRERGITPRCNPLYYMVIDKIVRSSHLGYSDLDQTIAQMFGVDGSIIDVLSNVIRNKQLYHSDTFNIQLGFYFRHHLYGAPNFSYDINYLSKLCPKFDFTNHKIK